MTAAQRPRLAVIAQDSTPRKATMPKTTPPTTREEKLAELKAIIRENAIPSRPRAAHRNLAQMRLADHVHLVRNSLDAVCALTQSTQPQGKYENGELDTCVNLGRDHLGALLELISDRLSTALEMDGS